MQANGSTVVLFDGTEGTYSSGTNTVVFAPAVVDLSAFAGLSSVDINFDFRATTVVNRDGWYIDDVTISGVSVIPEPSSFALLAFAGLGLLRRRTR